MRPKIDFARLRLALASLELWLCDLLLWLADACGHGAVGDQCRAQVRADLRRAEDGVRGVVVLLAIQLAGGLPPEPPRRAFHPFRCPRGFALRRARGNPVSKLTKILKLGGRDLHARIARLRAVARDIDRHAAHILKRLDRAPAGALHLVHALAQMLHAQLHAGPAAPAPDTS